MALDDMVNKAVHNALLTQLEVLVNSLQNVIKKVGDGSIHTEPGYVGPTIALPDAVTSQPIPPSTQSAGSEHPSAWPYGMPVNLWPPSSKIEAGSSSWGQEPAGLPMITRVTVPCSPPPTIPTPGTQTIVPPSGSASIPPRTRYYDAPDIDPAVFTRQIPQGQHLGVDYSEHFRREFPTVMSQAVQLPHLANTRKYFS